MPLGLANQAAAARVAAQQKAQAAASTADIAGRRNSAYDLMRQRAQQQAVEQQQQQGEALKRRFAALGNLNSGAYIKASQQAEQAGAEQANAAQKDINSQQAQEDYNRELQDRQYGLQQQQQGLAERQFATNTELQKEDLAASNKANAINALIGLGNADLGGVGTDAERINQILKSYGVSSANLPARPQAPKTSPYYNPFNGQYSFVA